MEVQAAKAEENKLNLQNKLDLQTDQLKSHYKFPFL